MRRHVVALSVAVVSLVALAASAASAPPGAFATSEVRVTPPTVMFGSVALGDTKTRMLSITNVSDHSVLFSSFGIHQSSPYSLFQWRVGSAWPPCPVLQGVTRIELMAGDTCEFPIWVEPKSETVGTHAATLEIDKDYATGEQLLVVPLSVNVR